MSGDHHDKLAARGRDAVKAVIDEMARLRAEVERLTQVDEEQERDHSEAIRIAGDRVAEAVDLRAEVKRLDMQLRVEGAVRVKAQERAELQRVQLANNAAKYRDEVERLARERDAWAFSAMTGRWREILHIEPNYDDDNEWGESVKMRTAFDALKDEASP